MAKHHIIGPSSADRWCPCPGSLFGPPLPDDGNDAANEGTVCHTLLQLCLEMRVVPATFLGIAVNPDFPHIIVTHEMVEGIELFLRTACEVCDELGLPYTAIKSEVYMVHDAIPNELFGGTTDCRIVGKGVLVTMDLKFGRKPVYADSKQLTCYSLLALRAEGQLAAFDRVIQIVIQPRANPPISRHEPGSEEITAVWNDVCRTAKLLLENPIEGPAPAGSINAGPHCKYCKRRVGCPAMQETAQLVALHGTFSHPSEKHTHIPIDASELSLDQLVWIEDRADAITKFLKDVKKALALRASKGEKIPGRKLTYSWGNRQWVTEDGDFVQTEAEEEMLRKKLARELHVDRHTLIRAEMKSPKQVEDMLKEQGTLKQGQPVIDRYTRSPVRGLRLVDERKRGEEVRPATLDAVLQSLEKEEEE